ncbi:MAG: hypothetical protein ACTSPW_02920 [Promethearchaeota archaeon]
MNKKRYQFFKSLYIFMFLTFLGGLYITNFERIWLDYRVVFTDYQCDCYLYAGNFFYQNQNISKTGIFIQETCDRFTYLIFNNNLEVYLYNFTKELSYSNFIIDFLNNNSKYVILNISIVNFGFIINFLNDFKILYKNDGNYTFGEYIV